VVITDWCDDYLACRICDLLLRWVKGAHFRAYSLEECGRFLKDAGFGSVYLERYKINWLWGLMTASGQKQAV
jgi:hypothetical protein